MKKLIIMLMTVVLLMSSAWAESATGALQELYAQAELLMVKGDYTGAAAKFEAMGTYSDASQMAMYCKAIAAAESLGLYSMAVDAFNDLGTFKDSPQMAKYYQGRAYEAAGVIDPATASDAALDKALWHLQEAEKVYGGLAFFKDSLTRMAACGERIKAIESEQSQRAAAATEATYQSALTLEQSGDYAGAIRLYQSIKGYKDSTARIQLCQTAILDGKYDAALALMDAGKYSEAIEAFTAIKTHRDSAEKITECETAILDGKYDAALALMDAGKYSEAIEAFTAIKTHRDSAEKIKECETAILDGKYDAAVALMDAGKYNEAIEAFTEIKNHRDSVEKIKECEMAILDGKYDAAVALMNEGEYSEAIVAFTAIKSHRDSAEKIKECETAILDGKYDAAIELMNEGQYSEAYDALVALNGHKDSETKIEIAWIRGKLPILQKAKVGSYVTFGTYEQDNISSNGNEKIDWLVLAKDNNRLLVISRYALDWKCYNTTNKSVSWDNCTLRSWLNREFFSIAFSSVEQGAIQEVSVSADKNPSHNTNPGKATRDKVFLLSLTEANKYFKTDSARQCKPTTYAKAQGATTISIGSCPWWVRTPGGSPEYAAYVSSGGGIYHYGSVSMEAVRPAMWIDLGTTANSKDNATTSTSKSVVITADSAKIRTEASISAGLVKTAYKGESFTLLGESGDFYKISVNGKTGYVHKDVSGIQ
ncbi:MAG: SH3 domain-containing protein [Clostridia bacterium]|nr:SH3 domain-containing protein [Clostridia bacterium]